MRRGPASRRHERTRDFTRREFLRLSALAAAGAVLSRCAPAAGWLADQTLAPADPRLPAQEDPAGFRLLNRLTFGPRPEERWQLAGSGLKGWIEEQLAPERIDDFELRPAHPELRDLADGRQ